MILNRSDYIKEGKNQLNHQQNYQSLFLDLTKNFKLELLNLLNLFQISVNPNSYLTFPQSITWKILPSTQNPQT